MSRCGGDRGLGLFEMRALDFELVLLLDEFSFGFKIGQFGDELLADQRPVHFGLFNEQRDGGLELADGRFAVAGFGFLLCLLPVRGRDLGAPSSRLGEEIVALSGKQTGLDFFGGA